AERTEGDLVARDFAADQVHIAAELFAKGIRLRVPPFAQAIEARLQLVVVQLRLPQLLVGEL
ncbi:MAG: hypothetical protein EBZ67_16560, partial [Chitinophagia bacterium]|nr:hypothetical protein [Chitinophagia bacterium]